MIHIMYSYLRGPLILKGVGSNMAASLPLTATGGPTVTSGNTKPSDPLGGAVIRLKGRDTGISFRRCTYEPQVCFQPQSC